MPTVQWSNDLARLAALSAKRCSTEFDQCRNTITFKRVAQLVFNQYSTGCININYREHIIKMIQTWFTQYQNANAGRMENFTRANPVYSAFAILVNQRVTHIGCGTVTFKQNRRLDVITICNFASRNMPGTAVYQAGDTASNCTTGTNPTYPGLCSIDEAVDPNAD
ncbi:allergen Tab y 5.0101-like [Hermetia illucens]|nr:allergen Tab y 5.0101-like [Hermetia illucens]